MKRLMTWLLMWNISKEWALTRGLMVAHFVKLGVAKLNFLLQPWPKLISEQNSSWHTALYFWRLQSSLLSLMVSGTFRIERRVMSYDCTPQLPNNTTQDVNESWAFGSIQRTRKMMSDYPSRGEKPTNHVDCKEETIFVFEIANLNIQNAVGM